MRTVFFDVDTQIDFLYPAGALYVPGAEALIPSFAKLTQYAASNDIQIVSTADAHTEDDPEFKTWKAHCVAGTVGQQKAGVTLLNRPLQQIVVEKQTLDAFANPDLVPLLNPLKADRYVLYGVATELCVRCAAFGLLEMGARVELVSDAVKSLNENAGREFLDQFQGNGGQLTTVSTVITGRS